MKKMLFAAIAMVAFTLSANAQSQVDHLICNVASINYGVFLENNTNLSSDEIKLMKQAYYRGCIDERNCHKEGKQEKTLVRSSF